MTNEEKWKLIYKYVSIKQEASLKKIKFYKKRELYQRSKNFEELLFSMERIIQGDDFNISLFENDKQTITIKELPFPKGIDKIILFNEYKNYPLLKDLDPFDVPFLFVKGTRKNFEEILNKTNESAISIVGSRDTPIIYEKWIEKRIPSGKIVVSGLANGSDLIGHRVAIKKNMKIIIFPGYEVTKMPSKQKIDVWNYALKEGLILSSVIPGVRTYIQADLIKRNYEMAAIVSETYALYFGIKSGTMHHLKAIAEGGKNIYVPKNIYNDVVPLLTNEDVKKSILVK